MFTILTESLLLALLINKVTIVMLLLPCDDVLVYLW